MKKRKRKSVKSRVGDLGRADLPWKPVLKESLRERLLRRWKGTPLEVKTLYWGPMQRDDEIGGEEMDSWLDDIARGRFVPAPSFSMEEAPRST